ncbi:hypothetical protein CK203_061914 [Vitis vinifera]|uniref:Uncharacterized protein n=1 Tax=Vitis vinifera TaxID=29760 RepID=A0A438GCI2_VITVI|nr:hypothetical protein CK203_061914 [Vitis vinifera]
MGFSWVFSNIYGPLSEKERRRCGRSKALSKGFGKSLGAYAGDFNVVHYPIEKRNCSWICPAMKGFFDLYRSFEFMDLPLVGVAGVRSPSNLLDFGGIGKVRLCSDLKHVVKSGRVWGDDQGLVEKYEIGCTPSFLLSKKLQALKTDLKMEKRRLDVAEDSFRCVVSSNRERLEIPFSKEKVVTALSEMRGDKAPDLNDFTMAF